MVSIGNLTKRSGNQVTNKSKVTSSTKVKEGTLKKSAGNMGLVVKQKKPATMQSTPANLKQLNKMAKQMMKGNREEMQRMRKMSQEIEQDNQTHTVTDESLSRHI